MKQSEPRLCSQPDRDEAVGQEGTLGRDNGPGNFRLRHQASGERALFAIPRTGVGRESMRARVQGQTQPGSKTEDPASPNCGAWLWWEYRPRQLLVEGQCLLHTLHEFQELVVVNSAIIVLVTILHELLDVILRDGLTRGLQHHLQLIQVNVAIGIFVKHAEEV